MPQPGFPDNYTDERFLEELVLNADVQPREYWAVVRGSLVVSQQLSLVVTSALVFYAVQQGSLTPHTLLRANGARARRTHPPAPPLTRLSARSGAPPRRLRPALGAAGLPAARGGADAA